MKQFLAAAVALGVAACVAPTAGTQRTALGPSNPGPPSPIVASIPDARWFIAAATIADLRTIDPAALGLTDSAIARVAGYAKAGDHGGVSYRYDAGCRDADTAATVLTPDTGSGCWRLIIPNREMADIRWFGAQPAPRGSRCDRTAFDNRVAFARAATVPELGLYFPNDGSGGLYCTSATFLAPGSLSGDGMKDSAIVATKTGFTGSIVVTPGGRGSNAHVYRDLTISANRNAVPAFGAIADGGHGTSGRDIYRSIRFAGSAGNVFTLDFEGGGGAVGATFLNVEISQNAGARLLRLGVGADDVTFIGTRMSMGAEGDNGPDRTPVLIDGLNTKFLTTFIEAYKWRNKNTAVHAVFNVRGGRPVLFDGLFVEVCCGREADLDYIFRSDSGGNFTVRNLLLNNGGTTTPLRGIILTQVGAMTDPKLRQLELANVERSNWPVAAAIGIRNNGVAPTTYLQNIDLIGIDDIDAIVASDDRDTSSGGEPRLHLTGLWRGLTLNHQVSTNGARPRLTHLQPTVIPVQDIDLIAARADSARIICPFRATVQELRAVIDGPLAGDATITTRINGLPITGGALTLAHRGSAANTVATAIPTATNGCNPGDVITHEVSGRNTGAVKATVQTHFAPRGAL